MRTIWRGIVRTVFWSYERGSWPYDVAVILIVIFVLLTPARWFHDQPQSTALASDQVQLVTQDALDRTTTYRIDASALPPEKRANHATPELERETHNILSNTVQELKNQTFEVVRIDPQVRTDGTVAAYDVIVRRGNSL
jgi:hypothetical protein